MKLTTAVVWWKDAHVQYGEQGDAKGVPDHVLIVSCGIVTENTDEAIKLASDVCPAQTGREEATYRDVQSIPKPYVERVFLQEIEIFDAEQRHKPRKAKAKQ